MNTHVPAGIYRLIAFLVSAFFILPLARAQVASLDITGGNGTASFDHYPGAVGGGWNSAWYQAFGAGVTSPSASALNTTPLFTGGGNYVKVSYNSPGAGASTYNARVSRLINTASIDLAQSLILDFYFRADAAVGSSGQGIILFGDSNAISTTGVTNSWKITADGGGWKVANNTTTVQTSINSIVVGGTYHFTINLYPANKTYIVSIDNLSNGVGFDYISGKLGFRSSATTASTSFLNFVSSDGNAATANTGLGFSLDRLSVAQVPKSASPAPDGFAVCADPQRVTDHDAFCDRLIASGVKWVRMSPEWDRIQPDSATTYDNAYLSKLDSIVNRLHAGGVNLVWILCYTADWASSQPTLPWPDCTRYKPMNWVDWENYVTFITNRYKGKICHWEVWNEPDHAGAWKSSVGDYAELLKRAYGRIKIVDPNNIVLLAGLAMTNGTVDSYGPGTFFDQLFTQTQVPGIAAYFDIVNYHAYGGMRRHATLHQAMLQVMATRGILSKPIWITETGYSTVGDVTKEPIKADMMDQISMMNEYFGDIERSFTYTYRNPVFSLPRACPEIG